MSESAPWEDYAKSDAGPWSDYAPKVAEPAKPAEPPKAKLTAAMFRRSDEIPSANPAPGAPGGPEPRLSAMAPAVALGLGVGPAAAPVAFAKDLALSLGGGILAGKAGDYAGGFLDSLPVVGSITRGYAKPVLGTAGALIGGAAPKATLGALKQLLGQVPAGSPIAKAILAKLETAAVKEAPAAVEAVAAKAAPQAAAKVVSIRPPAPVTPQAVDAIAGDLQQRVLVLRDMGVAPGDIAKSLYSHYETQGVAKGLKVSDVRQLVNAALKANAPAKAARGAAQAAPQALAGEFQAKVASWAKTTGLSRSQMASSLREQYPSELTQANARQVVDTVLDALKIGPKPTAAELSGAARQAQRMMRREP